MTAGLGSDYDGSEDGMHFGILANLEKLQRLLTHVCDPAVDRESCSHGA